MGGYSSEPPHQLRSPLGCHSMAPTAPPRMLPPPSKSLPPPSKTLSPPPSEAPLPLIAPPPAPRSSSAAALAPSLLLLLLLASEQTELPAVGRVTPPFASTAACVGGEAGLGALVRELLPEAVCWALWWLGAAAEAGALPAPVGAFLARIRSPAKGKAAVEKGVWKVGGREAVPKLGGWTKAGGAVAN